MLRNATLFLFLMNPREVQATKQIIQKVIMNNDESENGPAADNKSNEEPEVAN
jgi:hypothetical protein